jgi:hypothetical protein
MGLVTVLADVPTMTADDAPLVHLTPLVRPLAPR